MKVHFIKCTFISQSFMRKVNILGFRDGICNKKMHMLVIRCDALEIFYISSISSLYLFLSCEKPKVYESRCYVKSKRCITIILSFFSGKPWTTFCICLVEYFKENGEKWGEILLKEEMCHIKMISLLHFVTSSFDKCYP